MNESTSRRLAVGVTAALALVLTGTFVLTDGDDWTRADPKISVRTVKYNAEPVTSDARAKQAAVTNHVDPCKLLSQKVVDRTFQGHLPPVVQNNYTNSVGQRYCVYPNDYLAVSTRVEKSNGTLLYTNYLDRCDSSSVFPGALANGRSSYVYEYQQEDDGVRHLRQYPNTIVLNVHGVTVSITVWAYPESKQWLDALAENAIRHIEQFSNSVAT